MSSRNKKIFTLFFISVLLVGGVILTVTFLKKSKKSNERLINISYLSEEFVNNYLDEYKQIKKEDKENILIVTSRENIGETYGATNVIAAPNNQYILQYNNENDKNNALSNFIIDESIVNAQENIVYTINQTTYNSWGVSTMGLDHVMTTVKPQELNEVVVAIIDTGLDVELANKYYSNKITETYNVFEKSTTIMNDEHGHGTHVFGTIAESTPTNVKILPVKVSEDGTMYDSDIIAAINYITYYEKADVINMSFGGYLYSQPLDSAIEAAKEKNIISVAAAGNNNTSSNHYPSALDNTISIASVDSNLNKSSFSNYGSKIDFTAPGTSIKSIMSSDTLISKKNGNKDGDNDHETISGTSMATPHVASVVAVLKSYNKNLTLSDTVALLKERTIDLGDKGWDEYYGHGFISFVDADFCDGSDCDEYNVFKRNDDKLEVVKIEPKDSNDYSVVYNYGNITNLMNLSIKIYYSDDLFIVKKISDLEGIVIENYDPNIMYNQETYEGKQTVTIKYGNLSTNINIKNFSVKTVWQYEKITEDTIKLSGISIVNISNVLPNKIYFPEVVDGYKVVEIGNRLFKNNTELSKVFISSTIEKIGIEAFANCTSLSNVDLSNNIQNIGESAFKNTNLESIVFPETLLEIGDEAFENSKITSIIIPKNVKEIGYKAFAGCNNVEEINVDLDNETYDSRDNSNAIIKTATNTIIKGNYNTNLVNTIEVIGEYAFYNDARLEEIIIPDNIKKIEFLAFGYDKTVIESLLKKVVISKSVIEITSAFNTGDKNVTIYTYSDAVAKDYAVSKKISYKTMDYESISSSLLISKYNAFDKIRDRLIVLAYYNIGYYLGDVYYSDKLENVKIYDGDISNISGNNLEISYIADRDSLRFGDKYVIIKGKDIYNNVFETNCMVEVSKLVPEYTLPSGLVATAGQKLSEIKLPDGFSWMENETIITGYGNVVFKAKFIPDDTDNYEQVEDIEITINVRKTEVIPEIIIYDKVYDGTDKIDLESIVISNFVDIDYTIESITLSSIDVGKKDVIIKIKISDDDYLIYSFDNNKQEKEFVVDLTILPQKISKPTIVEKIYKYTGFEQIIELNNFDSEKLNISGNKRTIAGTQDVVISLKSSNYIWYDESSDNIIFKFNIRKADLYVVDYSKDVTVNFDNLEHSIDVNFDCNSDTNIRYMNDKGEYILEKVPHYKDVGTYVIKYKLYIDENYTEYFGEKTLNIISNDIINNSTDYKGVYDGKEHSINLDFSVSDYTIKYSVNNYNYDLDELPKFVEVGEYVVNYKVSCSECNELTGSNKVIIYGVKEIDKTLNLKNNVLVVNNKNNSFEDIIDKIKIFASSYSFSHYNQNNNEVNYDLVGTGQKLVININDSEKIEYTISISGDVTGDGLINIADVIKIADHTINQNVLIKDYEKIASDVTGDNIINIADVVKIADYTLDNSINLWR